MRNPPSGAIEAIGVLSDGDAFIVVVAPGFAKEDDEVAGTVALTGDTLAVSVNRRRIDIALSESMQLALKEAKGDEIYLSAAEDPFFKEPTWAVKLIRPTG